jgi:hypothetical protein
MIPELRLIEVDRIFRPPQVVCRVSDVAKAGRLAQPDYVGENTVVRGTTKCCAHLQTSVATVAAAWLTVS